MATFLFGTQGQYGEDHLRGQDKVLDLFRSLTFLRCLSAYIVSPSLACMVKKRVIPNFPGAEFVLVL